MVTNKKALKSPPQNGELFDQQRLKCYNLLYSIKSSPGELEVSNMEKCVNESFVKKAFAGALKNLMNKVPYDKISVTQIVSLSGYSRKTFYNHFLDKDDLLVWIFQTDIQELCQKQHIKNCDDFNSFLERMSKTPMSDYMNYLRIRGEYMEENCHIYANALSSTGPNCLYNYLLKSAYHCERGLISALLDYCHIEMSEHEQDSLAVFFAGAVVNQIRNNLMHLDSNHGKYDQSVFSNGQIMWGPLSVILYIEETRNIKVDRNGPWLLNTSNE